MIGRGVQVGRIRRVHHKRGDEPRLIRASRCGVRRKARPGWLPRVRVGRVALPDVSQGQFAVNHCGRGNHCRPAAVTIEHGIPGWRRGTAGQQTNDVIILRAADHVCRVQRGTGIERADCESRIEIVPIRLLPCASQVTGFPDAAVVAGIEALGSDKGDGVDVRVDGAIVVGLGHVGECGTAIRGCEHRNATEHRAVGIRRIDSDHVVVVALVKARTALEEIRKPRRATRKGMGPMQAGIGRFDDRDQLSQAVSRSRAGAGGQ